MKNSVLGTVGLAFMLLPALGYFGFAYYPMIVCIAGACVAFYALLKAIGGQK